MVPTGMSSQLTLLALTLLGLGVFAWSAQRRLRLLLRGGRVQRFDQLGKRLWGVISIALGQKKMFQYPLAGLMHALIFWGFLVFSVRTVTLFGEGLWPGFTFPVLGWWETSWGAYLFSKDLFAVLVALGCLYWACWRLVFRPQRIAISFEAYLILALILGLMLTDLLIDGAAIAGTGLPWSGWLPFSRLTASALSPLSAESLAMVGQASYWVHCGIILFFLNVLPYGKHFHVITAIPNTFFRNLGPYGRLPRIENIEEAENYGFSRIEHFDWKDYLDNYTCTECGRCSANCPATLTGKALSPKHLSMDLRDQLYALEDALLRGEAVEGPDLVHDVITTDVLWACTTCRACEQQCPVSIEFVDKIVQMRRHLVLELGELESEPREALESIERNFNPYSAGAFEREEWCRNLDVPLMSDVQEAEILYWVGCAGALDERNQKIARSLVRILKKAGMSFAILGNEEACTGDPARRIGNEYLFEILAQQNTETLAQYKFDKIIANCPHCFNTLKNEYPDYGAAYEVQHATDFVAELLAQERIRPEQSLGKRVVFHDSCYLGRYNDVYESPRALLDSIPGTERRDIAWSRSKGMCCGAGGGRMWMEETTGSRVNQRRVEQLMEARPEFIASACPFCMTMIEDGIKTTSRDEAVKAFDVLELLDRSLGGG